jgi:hypothetical protein
MKMHIRAAVSRDRVPGKINGANARPTKISNNKIVSALDRGKSPENNEVIIYLALTTGTMP